MRKRLHNNVRKSTHVCNPPPVYLVRTIRMMLCARLARSHSRRRSSRNPEQVARESREGNYRVRAVQPYIYSATLYIAIGSTAACLQHKGIMQRAPTTNYTTSRQIILLGPSRRSTLIGGPRLSLVLRSFAMLAALERLEARTAMGLFRRSARVIVPGDGKWPMTAAAICASSPGGLTPVRHRNPDWCHAPSHLHLRYRSGLQTVGSSTPSTLGSTTTPLGSRVSAQHPLTIPKSTLSTPRSSSTRLLQSRELLSESSHDANRARLHTRPPARSL